MESLFADEKSCSVVSYYLQFFRTVFILAHKGVLQIMQWKHIIFFYLLLCISVPGNICFSEIVIRKSCGVIKYVLIKWRDVSLSRDSTQRRSKTGGAINSSSPHIEHFSSWARSLVTPSIDNSINWSCKTPNDFISYSESTPFINGFYYWVKSPEIWKLGFVRTRRVNNPPQRSFLGGWGLKVNRRKFYVNL